MLIGTSKEINSILINNQMLKATDKPHKISNIFNTVFIDIGNKLAKNNIIFDNPIDENVPFNKNTYNNILNEKEPNKRYHLNIENS